VSVYQTTHFLVIDSAATPPALMDSLRGVLEADYALVAGVLPEFTPPDTIVMVIRVGPGIPFINGGSATFGQFLNDGTLSLSYIPHQLAHVWTGYQARPFIEEGLAVYVTTQLVPAASHPDPYRTELPHEWTSLFSMKGSAIDLATAYGASNFQFDLAGSSPDASAWELFVEAGSFTQWVVETFGRSAWLRLYRAGTLEGGLGATAAQLEPQWFQATQAAYPTPRPCEEALAPLGPRETFWCRRAEGQ
jgi:hypothetical protein